jgi:hypothetical protein
VGEMTRKGVALVALMMMLAAGVAFGEDYGPCYDAYRSSGLTAQQMTFDQFRQFYGDALCANDVHDFEATREGQVLGETR